MTNARADAVAVLLQAAVDRAKRDHASFIDIGEEVASVSARLPAGVTVDTNTLRTDLARLATANRIPIRMD